MHTAETETTPAAPLAETLAKPKSRSGLKLFVLLLVCGAAAGLWWQKKQHNTLEPTLQPAANTAQSAPEATQPATADNAPTDSKDIAELRALIQAQEARIAALETQQKNMTAATAPAQNATATNAVSVQDLLLLQKDLERQSSTLQTLSQHAKTTDVPLRQLQLWVLLNETSTSMEDGHSITMYVAQLQQAWINNSPRDAEALNVLSDAADRTIPTMESLQQDFDAIRGDVAAGILRKDVGFIYRLKAMLREQISVRRVDATSKEQDAQMPDPIAALDDIEHALKNGNLRAAIQAVEALPAGQAALSSWSEEANRRLRVTQSLRILRESLLQQLLDAPETNESSNSTAPFATDTEVNSLPETSETPASSAKGE